MIIAYALAFIVLLYCAYRKGWKDASYQVYAEPQTLSIPRKTTMAWNRMLFWEGKFRTVKQENNKLRKKLREAGIIK